MLDRQDVLASMTEAERRTILDQQTSKKEYAEASETYYNAVDDDVYYKTMGELCAEKYRCECIDNAYWRIIEREFSLFQRRIILDMGEITEDQFPTDPGKGMVTESDIHESLTPEEYKVIQEYELASDIRDEAAGLLNEAIDSRASAHTIGTRQLRFEELEETQLEASRTLALSFTRFQRRVIYNAERHWTLPNR